MKSLHLIRIAGKFEVKCVQYDQLVALALSIRSSYPERSNVLLDATLVRLLDRWSCACRHLILASASGAAIGRSARPYARPGHIPQEIQPIDWLRKHAYKKTQWPGWEPKWHEPGSAIEVTNLLQPANASTITNGLGASLHVDSLRVTRNAVVHRLPNTFQKLAKIQGRYGITRAVSPYEFILSRIPPTQDRLIDIWISDLRNSIMAAVD